MITEAQIKKLLDCNVSALDIMHGELKNMMLDMQNLVEEGSEYNNDWLEGYSTALTNLYKLTYLISFAEGN